MQTDNLPELICSRICHDLINPIGAINNGVELMTELGGGGPELELIGQSADTARAKVEFFRIAFGAAGNGMLGYAQARRVALDMFAPTRLRLDFRAEWGERRRALVKLLYLLLLCCEKALPRGGELACTPTDTGWVLESNAKTAPDPELWEHIRTGAALDNIGSAQIQFWLARKLAVETRTEISVQIDGSALRIAF